MNHGMPSVNHKDAEIERLRVMAISFAEALVAYMDGVQDHDIQSATGLPTSVCERIAETRRMAVDFLLETMR